MQFLLDHSLAVVCGAALLIGALTLQTRSQLHDVQETVTSSARSQAVSVAATLAEEMDNVLSEVQTVALFGYYDCRLARDASDERTILLEAPAYVRATPTSVPTPAHVRYQLIADGDSVQTSGVWMHTYSLEREVDLGAGYSTPQTVATSLVDLDVTFQGRASERTSGAPPLRFRQIAFELALALPDLEGDRRFHNVVRVGHVVRPPNLTVSS